MKRKFLMALVAILAIGLIFTGCPEDNSGGGKTPQPKPTGLTPWTPEPIGAPETGFKNFPADQLMEHYTSYAGEGGVALMTDNEDGTYKVEIKTNPGGVSLFALNGADYLFRNGYYLALNLPETTTHKPIAALTFAAVGPGEMGGNWDSTPYRVNYSDDNKLEDNKVYLAGDVEFFWQDAEFIQGPFRTVVLYLYWGANETDGYYEFTIKKALISEGDDLTPPVYPNVSWTPEPVAEPAGYVTLTEAEMLKAAFFAGDGVIPAGSIEKNTDGTYKVTVKTRPGAQSQVCFIADDLNFEAYYLSINIPPESAHKVTRVYTWMSTAKGDGGIIYPTVVDHNPGNPFYISGRVDSQWNSEENTRMFKTVGLWLYWHEDETAGDFEFTVNKLKVFEFGGVPPNPDDMTGFTPDPITTPTDWVAFPIKTSAVTFDPAGGTIVKETNGTYTVTAKTSVSTGHTEIVLPADDFAFKGGYYLSLNLPTLTKESANKPGRVYAYPKNGAAANWPAAVDINQLEANKWLQGRVDCQYVHETFGKHDTIVLQIYWHTGVTAGENYVFTIDKFFGKEEVVDPGVPDTAKVTGVKSYLQKDGNWGVGTWSKTYDADPFNGSFTNTAAIAFTSGALESEAFAYDTFAIDVNFSAAAVGKDYEFTLSNVTFSGAGGNLLTESDILAGFRGGNAGNNWGQQSGVVTKESEGVYKVKMTVIAEGSGGIAKLLFMKTGNATEVTSYSFSASMPAAFVDTGAPELTPWTQTNPPSAPVGWVDFSTSGPITRTIAANWDQTAIQVFYDFIEDDVLFEGGYYLSVTLPSDSNAKPITIRTTAYDATNNVQDQWVSQKQIIAPEGSYVSGTVVAFWDGNKNDTTPSTTIHKKIEFVIIFAPGTVTGGDYTFTVNAVKIPTQSP